MNVLVTRLSARDIVRICLPASVSFTWSFAYVNYGLCEQVLINPYVLLEPELKLVSLHYV